MENVQNLPEQDCLFSDFTQKCVNYVNLKIATKQRNLSTNIMFSTFTSSHHVLLLITKNNQIRHDKSHRSVLGWGESSSSASWISRDAELLKVEVVRSHSCKFFLRICAIYLLLNTKQEKKKHFLWLWHNSSKFSKMLRFLWHFRPIPLRKTVSLKIWLRKRIHFWKVCRDGSSPLTLLVTRESALLAMETKFHLGEDSGQGFTQIIPYPAGVTLPKLGNFTQAW